MNMKFLAAYKLPIGLSIAAFLGVLITLNVFDHFIEIIDIPASAFISVPLIAEATVFAFSALGLYLLTRKNFSPKIAALCGFGLGMGAFLCVAAPTIFLTLPPSYYQHILLRLISTAFICGGFLVPLFGAAVGYWMAKSKRKQLPK